MYKSHEPNVKLVCLKYKQGCIYVESGDLASTAEYVTTSLQHREEALEEPLNINRHANVHGIEKQPPSLYESSLSAYNKLSQPIVSAS